jgi:hypothetical protein
MYYLFKNLRKTKYMKRKHFLTALTGAIILAPVFFACSRAGEDGEPDGQIVLKANSRQSNDFAINFMASAKKISVNWGGGAVEEFTPNGEIFCSHSYPGGGMRTVAVNGEDIRAFGIDNGKELKASCPTLEILQCLGFELAVLDARGCTALKEVLCNGNELAVLDMGGCAALEDLACNNNMLNTLNVSGCTALDNLDCSTNRLASLNVGGFAALKYLDCSYNRLTSLNVSGCTALKMLDCNSNQLSAGALNALFEALPARSSADYARIYIGNNPGTDADECNRSIAVNKGWRVE